MKYYEIVQNKMYLLLYDKIFYDKIFYHKIFYKYITHIISLKYTHFGATGFTGFSL
jgi:hypothetical protein